VLDLENGARTFDHVLLGTGYRVDIARLGILSHELLDAVARIDGSPVLGAGFVSSVPNLHFVGSYAVRSYGPLLRFIAGAPFAAQAITRAALAGTAMRGADDAEQASETAFGAATADIISPRR
jgi:hypothetical protein